MTEKTNQPAEAPNEWRVAGLRLTILRTPTSEAAPTDWWAKIAGIEPESRTSKPKAGELLDQGPFGEGTLILSIRPERIDWQYGPTVPVRAEDVVTGFAEIGALQTCLGVFVPPMKKWLEVCPTAARVAFGVSLLLTVGNKEEGYAKLASYLESVKIDVKNSSDFSYQINRVRPSSTIKGLAINRLSRWAVGSSTRFQIQLIPVTQQVTTQPLTEAVFAAHAELDINTGADFAGDLPHNMLPGIFDELVKNAIEISERGDVA